jgi:hypothetical protein
MNSPSELPRCVRQFEVDEAVWSAYDRRRLVMPLLSKLQIRKKGGAESADWLAAEDEVGHTVEVHGHWADKARWTGRSRPRNHPSRTS